MSKAMDHIFGWKACWSCGGPNVKNGPFTVGCPGCDVATPLSEKASDADTQELLHPELREYKPMDDAVFEEMERFMDEMDEAVFMDDTLFAEMKRRA